MEDAYIMAEIITDGSQKELKKHGSDEFPLLVSYEKLSGYKSGSFLWHWHPEIEITLVLDGQILYKVNQCTYHMKAGDILLGNANVLHAGFMEDMKDGKYISITFLPKIIYGSYGSILRRKYVEPFLHNFSLPAVYIDYSQPWHEIFSEYVREIITLYEEKKEFYELDITGTLQKLWRCMLQNLPENLPYTEHSKLERNRMREIMDYLEHNYMNKIQMKDIAEEIHLCESECSRLFKRYMNVSLFTFLQEYRVERSLEFLLSSDDSIMEVAQKSGFTDSNYYAKVFSRVKGCSPQKYRKQNIRKDM